MTGNGWNEWQNHVLAELKRLNSCVERMEEDVGKIHSEIAVLKVKARMWGAAMGAIPGGIAALIWLLVNYFSG
jgi:hypothetical protein